MSCLTGLQVLAVNRKDNSLIDRNSSTLPHGPLPLFPSNNCGLIKSFSCERCHYFPITELSQLKFAAETKTHETTLLCASHNCNGLLSAPVLPPRRRRPLTCSLSGAVHRQPRHNALQQAGQNIRKYIRHIFLRIQLSSPPPRFF
jgi:hypothetical protein